MTTRMTLDELQQTLKNLSIFNALDERGINALSAIIQVEQYTKGQSIIEQGSSPNGIYILLRGAVKVSIETEPGAIVVLNHLKEGDVFGTLSAIDRKLRGASCIATGPAVAGRIAMLDFQDLMYGSSALALGFQIVVLRSIFHELRITNAQLSELSSLPSISVV